MQTACRELFLDCFWAGNDLGKCSLAPKFAQRDFLTIFSHGCTSQCLGTPYFFQQGCNLRAAGFIFREKCCKRCLPAPAHLDMDLGKFFQILAKCADEGERFCITPWCQWDTAPSRKRSGFCRIRLWEGSGSECQRAADYFIIAGQWAGDLKCEVSSTQDPPAPSGAQHLPKASEKSSEICFGLFWPCCFLLTALLVLGEIKWFIVAWDSFQIYLKQRNLNTSSGFNQNRTLVLENDITKLRNAWKFEGLKSLWGDSLCDGFYNSSYSFCAVFYNSWRFECLG